MRAVLFVLRFSLQLAAIVWYLCTVYVAPESDYYLKLFAGVASSSWALWLDSILNAATIQSGDASR